MESHLVWLRRFVRRPFENIETNAQPHRRCAGLGGVQGVIQVVVEAVCLRAKAALESPTDQSRPRVRDRPPRTTRVRTVALPISRIAERDGNWNTSGANGGQEPPDQTYTE